MKTEADNFDFSDLLGDKMKLLTDEPPKQETKETNQQSSLEQKDGNKIEFIVGQKAIELEDDNQETVEDDDKENIPSSDDTSTDDNDEDASGSFALAFAKFQQDEGYISEINEEELKEVAEKHGQAGVFSYLLDKQREAIFEEAKATYAGDQAELKEYFELKDYGVDVETARELAYNKKQFNSIKPEDLDDDEAESLRKSILTQYYEAKTSFDATKIKKLVESSVTTGDDVEESKKALSELKKLNEQQIAEAKKQVELQEKAQVEAIKKSKEDFKKFIYETDEVIKGQKINKVTQQKLEKLLLEPAGKDTNGNALNAIWLKRAENPQKFDLTLAYLLHTGMFDGKTETITKKAKTSAVTEFERILNSKENSVKGKTVTKTTETGILDEFLRM